ncbi:hypothetical protein [uncultured Lutibacter sp.]|uniref:hypothetical protein n=1 Tax=uncultured Lutibacter sp. TaxID=437739 RepID=UPI00263051CC|nr:hypothetical protein [uncultured Lutibacter sp.]
MKNQIKFFAVIFSVLVLFSCKDKEGYSKIENKQEPAKSTIHKIVINETLDGGNYTYLNVDESGNKYWMAIPNTQVKVGDTYYYDGGMQMKDFESKELMKTFDFITFAEGIRTSEKLIIEKQVNPHTNSDTSEMEAIKIEKPANGVSLNELFSDKESFSTKSIIVKGKVVKVNNGIMDKNWIHIIDGTQFEGEKDLGITTQDTVKIGDIITFKGIITLNKDFGHGYVYPILMEEGTLVK